MDLSFANTDFSGTNERRLRAMVHADVVGYSRLIGMNDAGTVHRLRVLRRALIDPAIRTFHGRIVNTAGDSMMIMFDSVDGAVQCAVRIQQQVPVLDGDQPPERRIRFRVGIDIGDIIADRTDVHGDGANTAARLQSIGPVGGICVSRAVRDHVGARLGLAFEPLGPQNLKNIAQPVEAFVLRLDPDGPIAAPGARPGPWRLMLAGILTLLLAAGGGTIWWLQRNGPISIAGAPPDKAPAPSAVTPADVGVSRAPRLSLVVLPFDNLDGTQEQNPVADGITEDLTTSLARQPGLVVTARNTSFTYKGKPVDIKRVGNELVVRYAVEGSVRKAGPALRVNVQLVSTETGAHLWAYHADADAGAGDPGRDEIIRQISDELWRQLIATESARSARERPDNPDAVDILLQAGAIQNLTASPQQVPTLIALYERALQLDPSMTTALAGLAMSLLDNLTSPEDPTAPATFDRVEGLAAKAEALKPGSGQVMIARAYLLLWEGREPEATAILLNVVDRYPNLALGYHMLGLSRLFAGRAAEVIPNEQRSIELDPHFPWSWIRYRVMDLASLFLGRYDEAVAWAQRSLAALPGGDANFRAGRYAEIAAAQALAGRAEEARAAAAEVSRLSPTMTVRGWWMANITNPVLAAQIAHTREGLRLAGVRDHANEDADSGVASDQTLHAGDRARTPTTAPGAGVIRTADLLTLLRQQKPLVLDVNGWGKSIPGAIALRGAGIGGTTSDSFQARLDRKMQELAHGDRSMPVVTMAWNADRFSGRNLALRLTALGYTNVIWYRGGREAWEVASLPETEVAVQDW